MTPSASNQEADVAIIGAGPAGTAAAIHLGQLGVRNVTLVDRLDFPRDKTCGSGLSPKGISTLKALGVWQDVEPASYSIQGLRLVTPGDRELFVSAGVEAAAVVCCRRTLDHILIKRAQALGVNFVPHFLVKRLIEEGGRVRGFTAQDGREIHAKYTIVADGAHSKLTPNEAPKQLIQAIMGWWDNVPYTEHHVEMVFDKAISPLYGWLFPESATRVNIGICYDKIEGDKRNARELFEQFLSKHYKHRLTHATQIGDWKGHPVSYSYAIGKLHSPGRVIIGEAGRMTHPATAEGISQAMRTGMFAAEALRDIVHNGAREEKALAAYEARCQRAFLLSFAGAKVFRKVVDSPVLDGVAALASQPQVKRIVGRLMAQM